MLKEKIAQEVKNAIIPEMDKIMVAANESAKESQRLFLNQVVDKLEDWEKIILEKVDQQVKSSLEKYENHPTT